MVREPLPAGLVPAFAMGNRAARVLRFQFSHPTNYFVLRPIDQRLQSLLQLALFAFVDVRPDLGGIEHRRILGRGPFQPFHDARIIRRSLGKTLPDLAQALIAVGQTVSPP